MQSILYTKTRGEKISDVTVHERWTYRVFVFGKVLFVRTKQWKSNALQQHYSYKNVKIRKMLFENCKEIVKK